MSPFVYGMISWAVGAATMYLMIILDDGSSKLSQHITRVHKKILRRSMGLKGEMARKR